MTPSPTAVANQNSASFWRRFLRWIGYGFPAIPDMTDLDANPEFVPGSICVRSGVRLPLKARLLLIFSGNIGIVVLIKTNVAVEHASSRLVVNPMPPGKVL